MRTFQLNDVDAAQVRAILRTHAELQDQRLVTNEEQRMVVEDEEQRDKLIEEHEHLEGDIDNLNRVADIFI